MVTDLPEPVAPAIRRCGILARFAYCDRPAISRPNETKSGKALLVYCSSEMREPRPMIDLSVLGISMPTRDLPGIGASMRTGVAAVSFKKGEGRRTPPLACLRRQAAPTSNHRHKSLVLFFLAFCFLSPILLFVAGYKLSVFFHRLINGGIFQRSQRSCLFFREKSLDE